MTVSAVSAVSDVSTGGSSYVENTVWGGPDSRPDSRGLWVAGCGQLRTGQSNDIFNRPPDRTAKRIFLTIPGQAHAQATGRNLDLSTSNHNFLFRARAAIIARAMLYLSVRRQYNVPHWTRPKQYRHQSPELGSPVRSPRTPLPVQEVYEMFTECTI